MEGLSVDPLEEVEILTDEYAVSHVYGDDLYALAYANGYVQAKNRLFQLDALRHVGYGDSASVLGPGQLKSDVVVAQELYTREELEAQLDRASDRARRALRAFANGVNRGLVEVATSGRIPGEFIGLGHVPEPWSPVDSLAIIAYMTGFFGVDGGRSIPTPRRLPPSVIGSVMKNRRTRHTVI
ncbi:MAG: penicillin acylase family protein [Natrialbaceae archaeon]|nr:penicillin acylase family protein [Natrialbaceae archaeon]